MKDGWCLNPAGTFIFFAIFLCSRSQRLLAILSSHLIMSFFMSRYIGVFFSPWPVDYQHVQIFLIIRKRFLVRMIGIYSAVLLSLLHTQIPMYRPIPGLNYLLSFVWLFFCFLVKLGVNVLYKPNHTKKMFLNPGRFMKILIKPDLCYSYAHKFPSTFTAHLICLQWRPQNPIDGKPSC